MKKKKIVTIGGGTGSFALLSGLKQYQYDITAIVTMADDGGSTGALRDELGVLPPGDVRQCLVALANSSSELRALMNYRFETGGLEGHSFGNLFLSALEKINGSFTRGVVEAIKILNVKGNVVPVSEDDMRLKIKLNDGRVLVGEKELDDNADIRDVGVYDVSLARSVRASHGAVQAIKKADYIIIGPGDHYGSIMPNLFVNGIKNAIKKARAKVIFVAPLTNKRGLTTGYTVAHYIDSIESSIGKGRVDFAVYNTKKPFKNILARYEKQEGKNSLVVCDAMIGQTYKIVRGDLLRKERVIKSKGDTLAHTRAFIRHDSEKLARAITLITEYDDFRSFSIS
ncbi:MAG: gluconeogenesis factor YvcK family protein [Parcubacteria group bacterium]|jgi:uncharacterized cofD-like protein